MNPRPPLPQSGALPSALYPEILPCFPQSHYIISPVFQNVNRFVKNCCTTFSKKLFSFCGILTKSPRWAGLREFSQFNGAPAAFSVPLLFYPPAAVLLVCFLFSCLPPFFPFVVPLHRLCATFLLPVNSDPPSAPQFLPSFPFTFSFYPSLSPAFRGGFSVYRFPFPVR